MSPNTLTIYPKGGYGDKNTNVQIWMQNTDKHKKLKSIVNRINQYHAYPEYKELNLFIKGNSSEWTMIESWGDNEDLFIEFVEFLGKELDIRVDIE